MSMDPTRPSTPRGLHDAAVVIPEPYDVRTSDEERELVVEALHRHAVAGRLDADELEQRLERAYGARLRSDLLPLMADLPAQGRRAPRRQPERPQAPRPERSSQPSVPPVVPIAVLLIAIWALTGAGYFWPMWPIGALVLASFGAFKHGRCARVSERSTPRPL